MKILENIKSVLDAGNEVLTPYFKEREEILAEEPKLFDYIKTVKLAKYNKEYEEAMEVFKAHLKCIEDEIKRGLKTEIAAVDLLIDRLWLPNILCRPARNKVIRTMVTLKEEPIERSYSWSWKGSVARASLQHWLHHCAIVFFSLTDESASRADELFNYRVITVNGKKFGMGLEAGIDVESLTAYRKHHKLFENMQAIRTLLNDMGEDIIEEELKGPSKTILFNSNFGHQFLEYKDLISRVSLTEKKGSAYVNDAFILKNVFKG